MTMKMKMKMKTGLYTNSCKPNEPTLSNVVAYLNTHHEIYYENVVKFGLWEILRACKKQYPDIATFALSIVPRNPKYHHHHGMLICSLQASVFDPINLLEIHLSNRENGDVCITVSDLTLQYLEQEVDKNWFAPFIAARIPEMQKAIIDFYQWYCTHAINSVFDYDSWRNVEYVKKLSELFNLKSLFLDLFEFGQLPLFNYVQDATQVDAFLELLNRLKDFICHYSQYKKKWPLRVKC